MDAAVKWNIILTKNQKRVHRHKTCRSVVSAAYLQLLVFQYK
jgi:hypothetical protein